VNLFGLVVVITIVGGIFCHCITPLCSPSPFISRFQKVLKILQL
jgi:ABC-type transporter Mla maintaining outer membrane lipid asymmetry permease subunit MlaE